MAFSPVSFFLGQAIARNAGANDNQAQNTCGVALAAIGSTPVGVLLTRQLALQRVDPPPLSAPPPSSVNAPPVASFGYAVSGLSVSFSDTSTDRDGKIVAWHWEFGDGAVSTEANPKKTYAKPGSYAVRLIVFDDKGASHSTSEQLAVSNDGKV
ncbi:MAG: PKD domain-containing protein [Luteimonas sp.]